MHKLTCLLLPVLLAACSPQQRLTRLLSAHPELRVADTLVMHHTFVTPADTAITAAPLDSLLAVIDSIQKNRTNHTPLMETRTARSMATLTLDTAGNLALSAIDRPDTLHLIDTCFVQVPPKITYMDRTVYRMTSAQRTAMAVAWTFIAAQLLFLILHLIRKFLL